MQNKYGLSKGVVSRRAEHRKAQTSKPRFRRETLRPFLFLTVLASLAMAVEELSDFAYPNYFPVPTYNFDTNPLTEEGIQLGRRLFYDEVLSADGTVSCASCHSPYSAFAHTDHDLSHGIGDQIGTRNAPALFNLAWSTSFHRDGAHHHLDLQALAPISHPAEMGSNINEVVDRLQADSAYTAGFARAWGDTVVTGERVLKSLAQFQLTLVSAGAKYDLVREQKDTFSVQEAKGYALFKAHCNSCHSEPLFTNQGFATNGLGVDTTLNDFGRVMITTLPNRQPAVLKSLHFGTSASPTRTCTTAGSENFARCWNITLTD